MSGDHTVGVAQAVRNYLANRTRFYATLLPRIPHVQLRELLRRAAGFPEDSPTASIVDPECWDAPDQSSVLLAGLLLRDLCKKPGFGEILGRTAISFDDALDRAQQVEETGVLLFEELSRIGGRKLECVPELVESGRGSLARLIQLEDDMRNHRIRIE